MTTGLFEAALAEQAEVGVARFTARDYRPGLVHHVVLFRFGPEVAEDQIREVAARFLDLATTERADGKPYILSIHAGPQLSTEGAGRGFEYGFVVEFASLGDRNFYLGQPLVTEAGHFDLRHDEFKQFVGPLLAIGEHGVLVFDLQDERMI